MKFSVILLTYNSAVEAIKRTMESIINQVFDDFELLIADDGSKNFPEEEVREFLSENGFTSYQMILNKENRGTIKNYISAIEAAQGKFIKVIGAGDLLYDENVISSIYDFLSTGEYKLGFGLMRSFYWDEGYKFKDEIFAPRDISPYIKQNYKKIKRNLFLCRDYICGASLFGEREYLKEYLYQMSKRAVYLEDYATLLMVRDGGKIGFLDRFVVYYESNSGVSTKKGSSANERLLKDSAHCWETIAAESDSWILKRNIYGQRRAPQIKNKLVRIVYRLLYTPHFFLQVGKREVRSGANGFLER